jgi:CubicO group peptidase (beta-lactamase class C family)
LWITVVAMLTAAAIGQNSSAQNLTSSLMERYLDVLREQAGIPGMSALVRQGGVDVWQAGFGRADLEGSIPATADTPYLIGGLSQTLGATLFLRKCVEQSFATPADPVVQWFAGFPETNTTVAQLLAHVVPATGAFQYDLGRFAALTHVVDQCSGIPYQQLVAEEILTQLGMVRSVPGTALAAPSADDVNAFGEAALLQYSRVLADLAKPYRLADGRRAVRSEVARTRVTAADGLVSTVYDIGRFDAALDDELLRPDTLRQAWTTPGPNLPGGFGWFVQTYNGELVVWQFGQVRDAYSALLVKVPERQLTFVLLANSDALAAPFARETWDITASVFARLFLLIHVP